jgi:hypothetical protein
MEAQNYLFSSLIQVTSGFFKPFELSVDSGTEKWKEVSLRSDFIENITGLKI